MEWHFSSLDFSQKKPSVVVILLSQRQTLVIRVKSIYVQGNLLSRLQIENILSMLD